MERKIKKGKKKYLFPLSNIIFGAKMALLKQLYFEMEATMLAVIELLNAEIARSSLENV